MSMNCIKCENLCLGYDQTIIAKDVTFSLEQGDYLCIIGENGAGKSTLVKTILGLEKLKSGTVTFSGGKDEAKRIGYLPQQTLVQRDFPATIGEIVISGCQNTMGWFPFYRKEQKELALSFLKKLDILHLANRSYRELSGGQQQRVLLARALCAAKNLIILDEPVAGLDPHVTEEFYSLVESINKDGMTVMMITHDVSAVFRFATKVLYMGKTPFFGTIDEFKKSVAGERFFSMSSGAGKNE